MPATDGRGSSERFVESGGSSKTRMVDSTPRLRNVLGALLDGPKSPDPLYVESYVQA